MWDKYLYWNYIQIDYSLFIATFPKGKQEITSTLQYRVNSELSS